MKAVSNTAFFCCGIRAADYEAKKPIVSDAYAGKLLGSEGKAIFQRFSAYKLESRNILMRHFLIDNAIQEFIDKYSDPLVIGIGSGLDSRSFRLNGGTWLEIDSHDLTVYKNSLLDADQCKNPLFRLKVDFSPECLKQVLSPYTDFKNVLLVMEGVNIYLDESQQKSTLSEVASLFPRHFLITDVMSKAFVQRYSQRFDKEVNSLGAYYQPMDNPEKPMLDLGYIKLNQKSVIEQGSGFIKKQTLKYLPDLLQGYRVVQFELKAEN